MSRLKRFCTFSPMLQHALGSRSHLPPRVSRSRRAFRRQRRPPDARDGKCRAWRFAPCRCPDSLPGPDKPAARETSAWGRSRHSHALRQRRQSAVCPCPTGPERGRPERTTRAVVLLANDVATCVPRRPQPSNPNRIAEFAAVPRTSCGLMIMIPAAPAAPRNCRLPILSSGLLIVLPPALAGWFMSLSNLHCMNRGLLHSGRGKGFCGSTCLVKRRDYPRRFVPHFRHWDRRRALRVWH